VTAFRVASRSWFVDLLLPPRCVACSGPGDGLCAACKASLRPLRAPLCARCGAPTSWPVARCRECAGRRIAFTTARAAFVYVGAARPVVHAWKERGLRRLGSQAAELVAERLAPPAADVITYIPPDPARQLRRATHPAEALAGELAARWGLPVRPLLARVRPAARQAGLRPADRRGNVRGLFAAAAAEVPDRVLLVDDVYTTGATASAAATALQAAGGGDVHVVTLARALR
jgi:predicted amidophosphoribosyltransferase